MLFYHELERFVEDPRVLAVIREFLFMINSWSINGN